MDSSCPHEDFNQKRSQVGPSTGRSHGRRLFLVPGSESMASGDFYSQMKDGGSDRSGKTKRVTVSSTKHIEQTQYIFMNKWMQCTYSKEVVMQANQWEHVFWWNDTWLPLGMQACIQSQLFLQFIKMWFYIYPNCVPFISRYHTTQRITKASSSVFLFKYKWFFKLPKLTKYWALCFLASIMFFIIIFLLQPWDLLFLNCIPHIWDTNHSVDTAKAYDKGTMHLF